MLYSFSLRLLCFFDPCMNKPNISCLVFHKRNLSLKEKLIFYMNKPEILTILFWQYYLIVLSLRVLFSMWQKENPSIWLRSCLSVDVECPLLILTLLKSYYSFRDHCTIYLCLEEIVLICEHLHDCFMYLVIYSHRSIYICVWKLYFRARLYLFLSLGFHHPFPCTPPCLAPSCQNQSEAQDKD